MRHESHTGEGIGYAETTFSELTLGHLARHMGTRGTRKSNSVAADSVRGQMRHIGLRPQLMMRLGPSSSERDKSSPGFQDLAMPLFESLYNFAHWLTQNREDAEDLVQETYVKALKGFASFRLGTNFRVWMFQTLRNTFLSSRARLEVRMTDPLSSEEGLRVWRRIADT